MKTRIPFVCLSLLAALALAPVPALAGEAEVTALCEKIQAAGLTEDAWDLAIELEGQGEAAIAHLLTKIRDYTPPARVVMSKVMARLGERRPACDELIRVVNDSRNDDVRIAALDLVASIGRSDLDTTLAGLTESGGEPAVKIAAARALWFAAKNPKAKTVLERYIASDDLRTREAAALALAEMGQMRDRRVADVVRRIAKEPTGRGALCQHLIDLDALETELTRAVLGPAPAAGAREGVKDLGILEELILRIQTLYNTPSKTDQRLLEDSAARGLMRRLDASCRYWREEDLAWRAKAREQGWAGLGFTVARHQLNAASGLWMIVAVHPEGPAARAGILPGDALMAAGDASVEDPDDLTEIYNDTFVELEQRLLGPVGSKLQIQVRRDYWQGARAMTLTRETLAEPAVRAQKLRGGLGVVTPGSMSVDNAARVRAQITAWKSISSQKMNGIVLDLRGTGGGSMATAASFVGLFTPKGTKVGSTKGRSELYGEPKDYVTADEPVWTGPLAVLVDSSTMQAAEIAAGAIRLANTSAKLIGRRTFGLGSEQQLFPLKSRNERAELRLTVAHWYLPDGTCPQGDGTKPVFGIAPTDILVQRGWVVWVYDEFAKLEAAGALDAYLAASKLTAEQQAELAAADGRDPAKWPGFDAWLTSQNSPLEGEHAVVWLRTHLRARLAAAAGAALLADLQEDATMRRGVQFAAGEGWDAFARDPQAATALAVKLDTDDKDE